MQDKRNLRTTPGSEAPDSGYQSVALANCGTTIGSPPTTDLSLSTIALAVAICLPFWAVVGYVVLAVVL
jgi:hypothetical protein